MQEPEWFFWLYLATWAPFAACLCLYGLRSPWRSSGVGRGLFYLYGAIVAILTLVLVVLLVDTPEWLVDVLRVLTLSGVCLAGFLQLKNLVKLQNERDSDPPPPTD